MKRHSTRNVMNTMKNISGKIMLAACLIFAASTTTMATEGDPIKGETAIRLLGKTFDSNFFHVKFNNEAGDKFIVTVKEKNGPILFQETYKEENFDKNFRVPRLDEGAYVFTFRNIKTNKTETFEIDTDTKVIEEVTIKKVN